MQKLTVCPQQSKGSSEKITTPPYPTLSILPPMNIVTILKLNEEGKPGQFQI